MTIRPAHRFICMLAAIALQGCEPAENVDVQPLPSLEASSPEARAGLPEIAGRWRFAGWELEQGDTARVASDLPGFGELLLEVQRLDSLAGFYIGGGGRMPIVGEVRRDGIVALVGGGRYLTGRYRQDTLWLSRTSLVEPGGWPGDARAAFVRSPVPSTFVRVPGVLPPLAAVDSLAADSAAGELPVSGQPTAIGAGVPTVTDAERRRPPAAGAEPRTTPPVSAPIERTPPVTEPVPPVAEPREPEPQPQPQPQPRPRQKPRLLGVPVDSGGDRS